MQSKKKTCISNLIKQKLGFGEDYTLQSVETKEKKV